MCPVGSPFRQLIVDAWMMWCGTAKNTEGRTLELQEADRDFVVELALRMLEKRKLLGMARDELENALKVPA